MAAAAAVAVEDDDDDERRCEDDGEDEEDEEDEEDALGGTVLRITCSSGGFPPDIHTFLSIIIILALSSCFCFSSRCDVISCWSWVSRRAWEDSGYRKTGPSGSPASSWRRESVAMCAHSWARRSAGVAREEEEGEGAPADFVALAL